MMKRIWVNKQGNKKCILFFNGWGMDENAINHLGFWDYDVCMFYHYDALEPVSEDLDAYSEIYLIAWSLGVWVAGQVMGNTTYNIVQWIALNGTLRPVDNQFGIPEDVFTDTLQGWSEQNRDKFNRRMMGGKKNEETYRNRLSVRTTIDQKKELENLDYHIQNVGYVESTWDKAIVGQGDLIFLPSQQMSWWHGKSNVVQMDLPHYPFIRFKNWEEIVMV